MAIKRWNGSLRRILTCFGWTYYIRGQPERPSRFAQSLDLTTTSFRHLNLVSVINWRSSRSMTELELGVQSRRSRPCSSSSLCYGLTAAAEAISAPTWTSFPGRMSAVRSVSIVPKNRQPLDCWRLEDPAETDLLRTRHARYARTSLSGALEVAKQIHSRATQTPPSCHHMWLQSSQAMSACLNSRRPESAAGLFPKYQTEIKHPRVPVDSRPLAACSAHRNPTLARHANVASAAIGNSGAHRDSCGRRGITSDVWGTA